MSKLNEYNHVTTETQVQIRNTIVITLCAGAACLLACSILHKFVARFVSDSWVSCKIHGNNLIT